MTIIRTKNAFVLLLLLALSMAWGTASAATTTAPFENCTLIGKAGQFHLDVVTPGVLTIKADLPSLGWWNGDTIDEIDSGYEYCLAAEIAHLSGLKKLRLHNVSFSKLVSGTLTGYDLSLDEISITPARAQVVSFSDPYYNSYMGVMTKIGSDVTAENIRSKTIGVKKGTTGALWVRNKLQPENMPRIYPGDAEALLALVSGQIDAYVQDVAIQLAMNGKAAKRVGLAGRYETTQSYGAMFPEGSTNIETVNEMIAWLKSQGYMEQLSKTFLSPAFGGDPTEIPVWTLE